MVGESGKYAAELIEKYDLSLKDMEYPWKILCVGLYDKTKHLIENGTQSKDFIDFYKELEKNHYLQLEFVPDESRKSPLCCEVLNLFEIVRKVTVFFAKAKALGAQYVYLSGGIVLLPSSGEFIIKDLKDGKILFQCKHIKHMENTRLFKFSHDEVLWGVVDDLGRVVAKEEYRFINFFDK